ncbi:MAG: transposase [Methanothrix sp.]|nr:transposase [Methanothrix sp.]
MNYFVGWAFKTARENKKMPENRLLQISALIDWSPIRKRLDEMYKNKTERGGRPNCDVIVMFKILILQQWYGLSDIEVERQIAGRLSFLGIL